MNPAEHAQAICSLILKWLWLQYSPSLILYALKPSLLCSESLRCYGIRLKCEELWCLSTVSKVIAHILEYYFCSPAKVEIRSCARREEQGLYCLLPNQTLILSILSLSRKGNAAREHFHPALLYVLTYLGQGLKWRRVTGGYWAR